MKRKGNGYVLERLTLTPEGTMVLKEIGDWDMRVIVEKKAFSALASNIGD